MHQRFNGIGGNRTGKLITLGLFALDYRHSQTLFAEVGVYVQHALSFGNGFFRGGVDGVSLLPQEFPGAQERTGGLFPADNADPLVVQLREIPVAVNNIFIVVAEQGF